jgi:hypothetical protein
MIKKKFILVYGFPNGGMGNVVFDIDSGGVTPNGLEKLRQHIKQETGHSEIVIINLIELSPDEPESITITTRN